MKRNSICKTRRGLVLAGIFTPLLQACGGGDQSEAETLETSKSYEMAASRTTHSRYQRVFTHSNQFEITEPPFEKRSLTRQISSIHPRSAPVEAGMMAAGAALMVRRVSNPLDKKIPIAEVVDQINGLREDLGIRSVESFDICSFKIDSGGQATVASETWKVLLESYEQKPHMPWAEEVKAAAQAWSLTTGGCVIKGIYELGLEPIVRNELNLLPIDFTDGFFDANVVSEALTNVLQKEEVKSNYKNILRNKILIAMDYQGLNADQYVRDLADDLLSPNYIKWIIEAQSLEQDEFVASIVHQDLASLELLNLIAEQPVDTGAIIQRVKMNIIAEDVAQKFENPELLTPEALAGGVNEVLKYAKGLRLSTETGRTISAMAQALEKLHGEARIANAAALGGMLFAAAADSSNGLPDIPDQLTDEPLREAVSKAKGLHVHRSTWKVLGGLILSYAIPATIAGTDENSGQFRGIAWGAVGSIFSLIGHAPAAIDFSKRIGKYAGSGMLTFLVDLKNNTDFFKGATNISTVDSAIELDIIELGEAVRRDIEIENAKLVSLADVLDVPSTSSSTPEEIARYASTLREGRAPWPSYRAEVEELLSKTVESEKFNAPAITSQSARSVAAVVSKVAAIAGVLGSVCSFVSAIITLCNRDAKASDLVVTGIGMVSATAFLVADATALGLGALIGFSAVTVAAVASVLVVVGFVLALAGFIVAEIFSIGAEANAIRDAEREVWQRMERQNLTSNWGDKWDFLHAYAFAASAWGMTRNAPSDVGILRYQRAALENWESGQRGEIDRMGRLILPGMLSYGS